MSLVKYYKIPEGYLAILYTSYGLEKGIGKTKKAALKEVQRFVTGQARFKRGKRNPMPSLRRTESLTAARLTHLLKQLPAKAKLIIHKSGLVQAQVPKRASNPRRGRRKNIAAGFYDEEGIFHPIRASHDYSGSRVGERKKRKKAKRRKR